MTLLAILLIVVNPFMVSPYRHESGRIVVQRGGHMSKTSVRDESTQGREETVTNQTVLLRQLSAYNRLLQDQLQMLKHQLKSAPPRAGSCNRKLEELFQKPARLKKTPEVCTETAHEVARTFSRKFPEEFERRHQCHTLSEGYRGDNPGKVGVVNLLRDILSKPNTVFYVNWASVPPMSSCNGFVDVGHSFIILTTSTPLRIIPMQSWVRAFPLTKKDLSTQSKLMAWIKGLEKIESDDRQVRLAAALEAFDAPNGPILRVAANLHNGIEYWSFAIDECNAWSSSKLPVPARSKLCGRLCHIKPRKLKTKKRIAACIKRCIG